MTGEHITFELADNDTCHSTQSIPIVGETEFGFTRYLYIIDDVKSSLVMAIVEKNRDEALFWAYELYFSGLKTDVFCILENIVQDMYSTLNPRLQTFLESKKEEWEKTNSYSIVGTFIYNMIGRPYDIRGFIQLYCNDPVCLEAISRDTHGDVLAKTPPPSKRQIYIHVEQKDVKKYITVNHIKPHYLLRTVAKYPVRTNTRRIFEHDHHTLSHPQIQSLYWYRWLYYASNSPIWAERIAKYSGTVNNEKHTVDFATYEDDEAFHDKYNLEPDEQPAEIQQRNIGDDLSQENQLTWCEFLEKYRDFPST